MAGMAWLQVTRQVLNDYTSVQPAIFHNGAVTINTQCCGTCDLSSSMYSQTSLIRASLIRMPHNPNTVPGNFSIIFYLQ